MRSLIRTKGMPFGVSIRRISYERGAYAMAEKVKSDDSNVSQLRVLIPEADVKKRIAELADEISKDYEGKEIKLICILKGGVFFTTELAKFIKVPISFDFMSVSSYNDETVSSGRVKIIKDVDDSVKDKDVLIIEDIIDSGNTLFHLLELFKARSPKSLKLCTLLDKPSRRVREVKVDYIGFSIPDEFVVGYGLDYKQNYRNLPYIGMIELRNAKK